MKMSRIFYCRLREADFLLLKELAYLDHRSIISLIRKVLADYLDEQRKLKEINNENSSDL